MSYAIFLRSVVCPVILNEGGRSCFYGATFGSSLGGVLCRLLNCKTVCHWSHLIKKKLPCIIYSLPAGETVSWWVSGHCLILGLEEFTVFVGHLRNTFCIYHFFCWVYMWLWVPLRTSINNTLCCMCTIQFNHIIQQVLKITSIFHTSLTYGVHTNKNQEFLSTSLILHTSWFLWGVDCFKWKLCFKFPHR